TGAPIELTPIEDDKGDQVSLGAPGDDLKVVVPSDSTSETIRSNETGSSVIYRMPDVNADMVPYLKLVRVLHPKTGVLEFSRLEEIEVKANPEISNFKRSFVEWPGAKAAVVATWTEKVDLVAGPGTVDRLGIWVETPGGATNYALATAAAGKLDGSTALNALRTLTAG
ncbi:MAG: hypothetical protein QOE58_1893, partial [Actinomycetota bacterium]|nr:hypothetical protein [Actinomycetota bacterium]